MAPTASATGFPGLELVVLLAAGYATLMLIAVTVMTGRRLLTTAALTSP